MKPGIQEQIKTLLVEPKTQHQLAQEIKTHVATVRKVIKSMHLQGEVFIAKWLKDTRGRDVTPFYMVGNEPDTPRSSIPKKDLMAAKRARDKAAKQQLEMAHD